MQIILCNTISKLPLFWADLPFVTQKYTLLSYKLSSTSLCTLATLCYYMHSFHKRVLFRYSDGLFYQFWSHFQSKNHLETTGPFSSGSAASSAQIHRLYIVCACTCSQMIYLHFYIPSSEFFHYIMQKVSNQRHSQSKHTDKTQELKQRLYLTLCFYKTFNIYLDRLMPGPHKESEVVGREQRKGNCLL